MYAMRAAGHATRLASGTAASEADVIGEDGRYALKMEAAKNIGDSVITISKQSSPAVRATTRTYSQVADIPHRR